MEFCPVCMLRKGLGGGTESGESSFEEAVKPALDQPPKRFEHYELVTSVEGKPVELGRGAMGVTYKALDVNLRCPVTLKVISERYLGDESARLRFVREARAAASVRHPNVATVFHLGRTGGSYFYFETARQYAMRGIQIWRSGSVLSPIEELDAPAVLCLCYEAVLEWHAGEIASCHATMAEAISQRRSSGISTP